MARIHAEIWQGAGFVYVTERGSRRAEDCRAQDPADTPQFLVDFPAIVDRRPGAAVLAAPAFDEWSPDV